MSQQSKVLVVFDQPATLKELVAGATGTSLKLLPVRDRKTVGSLIQTQSDACAIVIEQSARSTNTLEILENARTMRPNLRRVIVMDSPDLSSIVNGLHSGAIDAILYRPIDPRQFLSAVMETNPDVSSLAPAGGVTVGASPATIRRR